MPKICPKNARGQKKGCFFRDFFPYSVTGRELNITDETKCCKNIVMFCKLLKVSSSGEGKRKAKQYGQGNTSHECILVRYFRERICKIDCIPAHKH